MRIAMLLHRAYQYNHDDFVKEIFRMMLHREPDVQSLQDHLLLMASGLSKNDIVLGILNGPECSMQLQSSSLPSDTSETVMGRFQHLMTQPPDHFVHHLYVELLCRNPDQGGFDGHLMRVQQGEPRISVINSFMLSEEWHELIQSDRNFIARKMLNDFLSTL